MKTPKTCPRCGRVFSHRGNLNNHLKKQKICETTYLNIPREEIIKNYDKYEPQFNELKVNHTQPKPTKHKLKRKTSEPIIEQLDDLNHNITISAQPGNNSNEIIINKLTEIIGALSQNMKSTTVASEGSNILGDNSKQLNQHFNITVNTFGNEDLSHITNKDWHEIIKKSVNAIPELTKKIYIDEEKNRNVFLTSPKDGYCKVYTNDGWQYKGTKNILNEIIETNADRIYDYMENVPNKNKPIYRKMSRVIDKLGDENSLVVKQNISDIKELLINNKIE